MNTLYHLCQISSVLPGVCYNCSQMSGELPPPLFDMPEEPKVRQPIVFPEPELAQSRITGILETACDTDIDKGATWYFDVNKLCEEMAKGSELKHITPVHVAGIIAALSPMRSWPDNINKARDAVDTGIARGLGHTVETATTIWHGFDPEIVISRTGNNPKVYSFFKNIAYPETSDDVTIDRHMWNLLFDDLGVVEKAGLRFKGREYQWAASQFRTVASGFDLLPHQLQAISWLAWRRKQGIVDGSDDSVQLELSLI